MKTPVVENFLCGHDCPYFIEVFGDKGCVCKLLNIYLDYYDGWLAACTCAPHIKFKKYNKEIEK